MTKQQTIIEIFVASPGDVSEEREVLESIVSELNKTWSNSIGAILSLLKWETSVHAGFDTEPQEVINKQIGDEYDVFLGIFWSRIGSPTSKAISGTVEEFERALQRRKKSNHPEIILYFKDEELKPSEVDIEQLGKLLEFKKSIANLGGLYSQFNNISDFESLVRSDLSVIVQKLSGDKSKSNKIHSDFSGSDNTPSADNLNFDDDDIGFFDCIEIYQDRFDVMTNSIVSISNATNKIAEAMSARTKELTNLNIKEDDDSIKKIKRVINYTAKDYRNYTNSMTADISTFTESRNEAFSALSKTIALYEDFTSDNSSEELDDIEEAITILQSAISSSQAELKNFTIVIESMPRATTEFNRERKQVVKILKILDTELDSSVQLSQHVLNAIKELRQNMAQ